MELADLLVLGLQMTSCRCPKDRKCRLDSEMGGVGRRVQKAGPSNEGIRKNSDIIDVEILPGKGFGLRFHGSDRLHRDAGVGLEPNSPSLGSDDRVTKRHGG